MKLIPISAALLAAGLTIAVTAAPALPISAPPYGRGQAASTVFEAYLAITRAARDNPGLAQRATPSYETAVQQYNAGDFAGAQATATGILQQTAPAPLPQPSLYPLLIPQPPFYPIANPDDIDQAFATGTVAVARQALSQCGAPTASPAPAILAQFAAAANDLLARDYNPAEVASEAVVTACGQATQAYAAQQAALPHPPSTPIPMESYSPIPVATLIPDPALQRTPAPVATPAPTQAPRHGLQLF